MIIFAKDLGAFEGESKYDLLAISVARSIGIETKFESPECKPTLAVSQFGDGLARIVTGQSNIYVFHDWYDAYLKRIRSYDLALFLGEFDHPMLVNSYSIDSYPVDKMHELPTDKNYPLLVCGEYEPKCHDWLVKRVSELAPSGLRLVCYNGKMSDPDFSALYTDLCNVCGADRIDVGTKTSIGLLGNYMIASEHILHCGGHRGMVHSMAVSTGKCESFTGDDGFVPSTVSEFNAVLLPFT